MKDKNRVLIYRIRLVLCCFRKTEVYHNNFMPTRDSSDQMLSCDINRFTQNQTKEWRFYLPFIKRFLPILFTLKHLQKSNTKFLPFLTCNLWMISFLPNFHYGSLNPYKALKACKKNPFLSNESLNFSITITLNNLIITISLFAIFHSKYKNETGVFNVVLAVSQEVSFLN